MTTRWSIVLQAGGEIEEERQTALATLCEDYWYPVYAFVRRQGNDHHDAQDLTQGFFEQILERDDLGAADPDKGRFRSYVLSALGNFMAKEYRRSKAKKRGGGAYVFSIDGDVYDNKFMAEPSHDATPELIYHRAWANTLLEKVLGELGAEYEGAGKGDLFGVLKEKLSEIKGSSSNVEAADKLGVSTGAVAVALHRMRGRYRELLRRAVCDTLRGDGGEMDVDAEIQLLLGALQE